LSDNHIGAVFGNFSFEEGRNYPKEKDRECQEEKRWNLIKLIEVKYMLRLKPAII